MVKKRVENFKVDPMTVTVLLVMTVFGGIVGYFLGLSAAATKAISLCGSLFTR